MKRTTGLITLFVVLMVSCKYTKNDNIDRSGKNELDIEKTHVDIYTNSYNYIDSILLNYFSFSGDFSKLLIEYLNIDSTLYPLKRTLKNLNHHNYYVQLAESKTISNFFIDSLYYNIDTTHVPFRINTRIIRSFKTERNETVDTLVLSCGLIPTNNSFAIVDNFNLSFLSE